MFDFFDTPKLLILGIVALLVIPPKDLPTVLRQLGQMVGKVRRMAAEFQNQFKDALAEAEIDTLKRDLEAVNEAARRDLDKAVNGAKPIETTPEQGPPAAAEPVQLQPDHGQAATLEPAPPANSMIAEPAAQSAADITKSGPDQAKPGLAEVKSGQEPVKSGRRAAKSAVSVKQDDTASAKPSTRKSASSASGDKQNARSQAKTADSTKAKTAKNRVKADV